MSRYRKPRSVAEVVTSGLCIGCGLCEAVSDSRIEMRMTDYGSLRPTPADEFTQDEEKTLLEACPGVAVRPRQFGQGTIDPVWGEFTDMRYAWAGDREVRFRAATGGVLSSLGIHLLKTGEVSFILHVKPDPEFPMRSRWTISKTAQEVMGGSSSRYGPVSALSGFLKALDENLPFAIIAKPCDLAAVHNYAKLDDRVDDLCKFRLAMVCGGTSRLKKSQDVLDHHGVEESELAEFRYRGFGNPGRMHIKTRDGQTYESSYNSFWEDESNWQIETRCKLCPDALGEAADIAAADVWPGGAPVGEDEGFNGIIVRSPSGANLVQEAVAGGDLMLGDEITPQQFNDMQPHQTRKKFALTARFDALADSGFPVVDAQGLRLNELSSHLNDTQRNDEYSGTCKRIKEGRISEPLPDDQNE